jgi:hypothetical protein
LYYQNAKLNYTGKYICFRLKQGGENMENTNRMAEVAKMFGKKMGEEFTVRYEDKVKTWKFDERGLLYHNAKENEWRKNYGYLDFLIRGKAVIIDEAQGDK